MRTFANAHLRTCMSMIYAHITCAQISLCAHRHMQAHKGLQNIYARTSHAHFYAHIYIYIYIYIYICLYICVSIQV